MNTVGVEVIL